MPNLGKVYLEYLTKISKFSKGYVIINQVEELSQLFKSQQMPVSDVHVV